MKIQERGQRGLGRVQHLRWAGSPRQPCKGSGQELVLQAGHGRVRYSQDLRL